MDGPQYNYINPFQKTKKFHVIFQSIEWEY